MKSKSKKDAVMNCKISKGKLVVEIGIGTLAFAFENSDYNNPWDTTENKNIKQDSVANKKMFAEDVVRELLEEAEDGSSMLTKLFDDACQKAVENGSIGIKDG